MHLWLLRHFVMSAALVMSAPRHGTWVYKIDGRPLASVDPDAKELIAVARSIGLTEVYLSAGAAPLAEPRTPAIVRALKAAGLRVEALLDQANVADAVRGVIAYNRVQQENARFDGVHYDYEPWIKSGDNVAWVPPLIRLYDEGRALATEAHLGFAADISGPKFAHLPLQDRRALRAAASRLVLMHYEAPLERVMRQCDETFRGEPTRGALLVAVRVEDFTCRNMATLLVFDASFAGLASYGGWATYSYNAYRDRRLCPTSCCRPAR